MKRDKILHLEAYQYVSKKGVVEVKDALATVGGSLIYFALIRWL